MLFGGDCGPLRNPEHFRSLSLHHQISELLAGKGGFVVDALPSPGSYPTARHLSYLFVRLQARSYSRSLNVRRLTFPVSVIGRSVMYSTARGYL